MECPKCEGKGFIEHEAGTIMVKCEICGGKGDYVTLEELAEAGKYVTLESIEAINNVKQIGQEGLAQLKNDAHELGIDFVEAPDDYPKYLLIPGAMPGKTIDETADTYRKIIKASKETDDSNSGDRPDNSNSGSADTSQSRKLSKSKTRKQTRKRAS